ncbi:hypothetical protein ACPA9J_14535 [Pseudomonas aeruginosa]
MSVEHGSSFLQSGVVFLIAAVFMVPLAKRLHHWARCSATCWPAC